VSDAQILVAAGVDGDGSQQLLGDRSMFGNSEPGHASGDGSIGLPRPEVEKGEPVLAARFEWGSFLRRQLPYVIVLGLAIVGVAYTNMAHQPLVGYWEFLALATGLVCIVTEWPTLEDRQARVRLIWTQSVHWVAILVAMNIMLLSGVQQFVPAPATSLVLLLLLALGTFLAGLNLSLLPICFLGIALALAVPVISWLKQSVLFLVLIAVFFVGIAVTLWPKWSKQAATSEEGSKPGA
jgi:hypothetical protein